MRARERDRAGVRTYARTHNHVRSRTRVSTIDRPIASGCCSHHSTSHHITSHHITATANTTINNTQSTIHKQTRSTNEKWVEPSPSPSQRRLHLAFFPWWRQESEHKYPMKTKPISVNHSKGLRTKKNTDPNPVYSNGFFKRRTSLMKWWTKRWSKRTMELPKRSRKRME
jgi:hypothetical protein